jgi:hypothetical protein
MARGRPFNRNEDSRIIEYLLKEQCTAVLGTKIWEAAARRGICPRRYVAAVYNSIYLAYIL